MALKQILKKNLKGDPIIWIVTFVLSSLSILTVYSASSSLAYRQMFYCTEHYLFKQFIFVCMGWVMMWLAHRIDYRYYAAIAKIVLWLSIPLLIITWKYGLKIHEASRWIRLPWINKSFQPSDIAQLALIVRLAYTLFKHQNHITSFSKAVYLPMFVWCSMVCLLIALTNSSNALLLFIICLVLMYIGRVPISYLLIFVLSGCFVAGVALSFGQRKETVMKRVHSFFNGELSFQTKQAYIAIATGALTGKGPGNSTQRNFLPHPYSDFIYAILIEEYGLLGGGIVLLLYMIVFYRAIELVKGAKDYYGALLAVGIGLLFTFQALLNMAVAVGLVPVTGLPLPFVSMGGTSMVLSGISLGMLLSISQGTRGIGIANFKKSLSNVKYNQYKK